MLTYTYDEGETSQRGNVTTTWTPASGSGAMAISKAGHDASCGAIGTATSYVKCNKPN